MKAILKHLQGKCFNNYKHLYYNNSLDHILGVSNNYIMAKGVFLLVITFTKWKVIFLPPCPRVHEYQKLILNLMATSFGTYCMKISTNDDEC